MSGIPISDEQLQMLILQRQMEEQRREARLREQTAYAVFVSYSHRDREIAARIGRLFDQRHISYIIDEKKVEWGDTISEWARQQLAECTHYLLILSAKSAESAWCQYEYGLADGLGKRILVFLTEEDLVIPAFATSRVAIGHMEELEEYFARDLIDGAAVDRFIAEILGDSKIELERFVHCEGEPGLEAWEAPDREAIERSQAEKRRRAAYLDIDFSSFPEELLRIEFGTDPARQLVLYCKKTGYLPSEYELSYSEELNSVVINAKKPNSELVGVREQTADGRSRLRRAGSLQERLTAQVQDVYGWGVSRDFWAYALRRLRQRLAVVQRDDSPS